VGDVSECDILMGIKEVPTKNLIEEKTYLFFSHTMKSSPTTKGFFRRYLEKKLD